MDKKLAIKVVMDCKRTSACKFRPRLAEMGSLPSKKKMLNIYYVS